MQKLRFGQLTYASFDRGDGSGGGWHVHEQTPDLSAVEVEALRKHAVTAFNAVDELPQFPTQEQVAALPRRLSYFPLYSSSQADAQPQYLGHAFVHAAPAGLDATQRPGNVFSHLLIDRDPAATEHRPVELWRSDLFRAPYGPKSVLESALPESPGFEQPGTYVTPLSVRNFILDDASGRLPVLAMLLDGARAAVNGTGARIVLGTDSPDRAAFWIGAVSMLTTDEWARHLAWSVFERAADLSNAWNRGVHIAAVPRSDLEHIDASNVIVIDELGTGHSLGSFETTPPTPHRSEHGSDVQNSAWADLVVYLLQMYPDRMPQVFERLDAIAALEYTPRHAPEWALAMATLPLGLSDLDEITQDTIVSSTPIEITEVPWLTNDAVAAINRGSDEGTASAYTRLSKATPDAGSLGFSLLYRSYLALALTDSVWLQQHDPTPLPQGDVPSFADDETLRQAVKAGLRAPLEALQADHTRSLAAAQAIHTFDLLIKVGLLPLRPPHRHSAEGDLQLATVDLIEMLLHQVLRYEDRAAAALQLVPHVAKNTRDFVAVGAFGMLAPSAAGAAAFAQIPPSALGWFRQQHMPTFVSIAEEKVRTHKNEGNEADALEAPRVNQLAFELVAHQAQQTRQVQFPFMLLFGSLQRAGALWSSIPVQLRELLLPVLPQNLSLLALAERYYPGQVPAQVIDQVLLQAQPSQELSLLMQELNRSAQDARFASSRSPHLLRARDAANRYESHPQLSLVNYNHLQVLASARVATANISSSPLPSAAADVALQTALHPLAEQQHTAQRAELALNMEVYGPLIIAAAGYIALTGDAAFNVPQQQLIREARQVPRLELLVQALINFTNISSQHQTVGTELLIDRSLLAAGFRLPRTKVPQNQYTTVLDDLHIELDGERKQDRALTVYDAALRELYLSADSPQATTLNTYRDDLLAYATVNAEDDKDVRKTKLQFQKAVRRHFEGLEPRGSSLLGSLFKVNKNEEEN